MESAEHAQDFSLRSKLEEKSHLSSGIWFSVKELLTELATQFCHDWELAIVLLAKLCKLKMQTLLTAIQMCSRKYLERKLVVSIPYRVIV